MPKPPLVVFTIGHSNRSVDEFLGLLRRSGIRQLADVRRRPFSRRNPQFEQETLEYILNVSWVSYRHLETLGGHREPVAGSPHCALDTTFRGYADHMGSDAFALAVEELLAWARSARTAVLCAEADPTRCHRHLLGDYLAVRGVRVVHILDGATIADHNLSALARVDGERLIYDAGRLELDFEEPRQG